ncbi:MAG TPA: YcnI family protein [Phenylobacterium sp.]|nr:YcnI family protein [Phenylobacterium sp.]
MTHRNPNPRRRPAWRRSILSAAALCAIAAPALAHVAAEPRQAAAGAYQVITFRVGHGCGPAATTALRVELPLALGSARPRPKPGWKLSLERDGERVTAVIWSGELPGDQFDEFAILARLPGQAGPLYFPTVQTCGAQQARWTEIPGDGGVAGSLAHPAPVLLVTSPQGVAEAHSH